MARWRRKSPESQEPRLINGENLASDQRSELAKLALHCQQVTTEIGRELSPGEGKIDYDNLTN